MNRAIFPNGFDEHQLANEIDVVWRETSRPRNLLVMSETMRDAMVKELPERRFVDNTVLLDHGTFMIIVVPEMAEDLIFIL